MIPKKIIDNSDMKHISEFLEGKLAIDREDIHTYNPKLLKLVAVDFVS
jgi:hypothetical protein